MPLLLLLAAFLLAGPVAAAVWTVDDDGPADFSSIQAAINAASNGDEIVVRPGRYNETLVFQGKAITVRSEAGPRETIVFLEGQTRIVELDGSSTLRGFTITGGGNRTAGAGILVTDGASPTIEENLIEDISAQWNEFTGAPAFGGGIAVELGAEPVIRNNVIRGNRALGDVDGYYAYGGGIQVGGDATGASIINNLIVDNQATSDGGGIHLGSGTGEVTPAAVTNNTITGNRAGREVSNTFSFGGGVYVYGDVRATIRNNAFVGNGSAYLGGGIYFQGNGLKDIDYDSNDFDGNLPDDCAGLTPTKCEGGQYFVPAFFINPAAGDYRLRSHSFLIDHGSSTGAPAVDLDGRPRPVDGDLDGGAAPDIGAYENQAEVTRVRFTDAITLQWDGSNNPLVVFDVYRDALSALQPGPLGRCWRTGVEGTSVTDTESIQAGDGYFYLVVGWDAVTGSLGFDGEGIERSALQPCP